MIPTDHVNPGREWVCGEPSQPSRPSQVALAGSSGPVSDDSAVTVGQGPTVINRHRSALTLLSTARDAEFTLRLDGDRLVIRGPRSSASLVAELLANKDAVVALLEQLEERAAIMEFDGGLPRAEAERQAGLFPEATAVRDPEASGSVGGQ